MVKVHTVLGISPGTRSMGIALYSNGMLIDWRVMSFRASWSNAKLKDILYALQSLTEAYTVTRLVIRNPDEVRKSKGLEMVVRGIVDLARRKNIRVKRYSLDDLKRFCSPNRKFTKAAMAKVLAERNEIFHSEYNKELKNKHPYYQKMFEAIIAILVYMDELEGKKRSLSPYSQLLL
jgi:hypothetical protein